MVGPNWSGRTVSHGSFVFLGLPQATDSSHHSVDYTITFAPLVAGLLMAPSNDNTHDSIEFGLLPRATPVRASTVRRSR